MDPYRRKCERSLRRISVCAEVVFQKLAVGLGVELHSILNLKRSHKFIFDDTSPYQYPTSTLLVSESEWSSLPFTDPASGPSIRPSRVTLISSVQKTFENLPYLGHVPEYHTPCDLCYSSNVAALKYGKTALEPKKIHWFRISSVVVFGSCGSTKMSQIWGKLRNEIDAQFINDLRVPWDNTSTDLSSATEWQTYGKDVAFYIPMTVMLIMYQRIFVAAKISAEKHKFVNIPRLIEQEGIYCLEDKIVPKKSSKKNKAVEEFATLSKLIRQDRKNISIFKREQKAARTLGIIVGAFTFCWLPFFLLSTARPFICGIRCSCMPVRLERTLLWLGYTNSLINPLIYAFFNRDLRTTFWNLLRCKYTNINRRLSAASMHEALKVTERHEGIL
ncbi:unnamed protein product [Ranitomeya imitator]|uniref:G-protein coupled receptors family 1 profile domain-containing protein n=1 Tax=Ranitomeya imitator TaxID=111125 RepID=A0ABN9LTL4_9NEOB|nr:unnamed protein product [Ranitomeya imitator]